MLPAASEQQNIIACFYNNSVAQMPHGRKQIARGPKTGAAANVAPSCGVAQAGHCCYDDTGIA
jgi:hypothetical protein